MLSVWRPSSRRALGTAAVMGRASPGRNRLHPARPRSLSSQTVEENLRIGEMPGARAGKKLYHMVSELFPVLTDRRRQRPGP